MKPIAFYPQLAIQLGDIASAIYYQQLYFWSDKGSRDDGFIYKTQECIERETTLTKRQQNRIKESLVKLGWIEVKKIVFNGSPVLHYRCLKDINFSVADKQETKVTKGNYGKVTKGNYATLRKVTMHSDETSPCNVTKGNFHIYETENTTENTTESTTENQFSEENLVSENVFYPLPGGADADASAGAGDDYVDKPKPGKAKAKLDATPDELKQIGEVINVFKELNPFIKFNNPFYRRDALQLIRKFGADEALSSCRVAVQIGSQPYAPKITNPSEMIKHLGRLRQFIDQEKNMPRPGVMGNLNEMIQQMAEQEQSRKEKPFEEYENPLERTDTRNIPF